MLTRNRTFLLLALGLAVAAVLFKVPLASSQGLTIVAAEVAGDLPVNAPQSDLWQQATAVQVPLSAQMIARPIQPQTTIKSVTARGLHNGQELALLLEWADPTADESTLRVDEFRDSVAVQFPLAEGQPYFCMGQQGGDVNIWHWKADWQAAIDMRQDLRDAYPDIYVDQYPFTEGADDVLAAPYVDVNYLPAQAAGNLMAQPTYASPVEDLVAGGFGSLTSQPLAGQNVQGHGEWSDGVWRVVFTRSLTSEEIEDVSLAPNKVYSVAFAAWDGANQERNGAKSTSQWVSLQIGGTAQAAVAAAATATPSFRLPAWAWVALLALLTLAAAVVLVYYTL